MAKLSKKDAIEKLNRSIEQIDSVKSKPRFSTDHKKWHRDTEVAIKYIFGEGSNHLNEFMNLVYGPTIVSTSTTEHELNDGFKCALDNTKVILQSMVQEIEEYWEEKSEQKDKDVAIIYETFWNMLHPEIVKTARSRFESGHYADSVEAVLKYINNKVKRIYRSKKGIELDGADLMSKSFTFDRTKDISSHNPVIILDDLRTETGRNIQEGYRHLFVGSMKGIRNPKAHDNIKIDEIRAAHFLFLASLLMHRLDEKKKD